MTRLGARELDGQATATGTAGSSTSIGGGVASSNNQQPIDLGENKYLEIANMQYFTNVIHKVNNIPLY
jgi:hypothetical protein